VMSMAHLALTMANIVTDDLVLDSLQLTEDYLNGLYDTPADLSDVVDDAMLAEISDNITSIGEAIDALGLISEDNDFATDFEQFQDDFDQNGDGSVTLDELEAYLDNLGNP
jgi:hypothetical protein